MVTSNYPKRHFHTFDALRFFASFKVFIHHLPIVVFPWFCFVKAGGGIGVQFFFVLSGFLITYIILEEKENKGKLSLIHFFSRRVLRIWPLFYLAIAIAFITPYLLNVIHLQSSPAGYEPNWLWSVLFLENYRMILMHSVPNVSPLGVMWSLCIEEHFYIVWGLLLFFLNTKKLPWVIGFFIILSPICRYLFAINNLQTLDLSTNIDLFAYGAVPAYLLVVYKEWFETYINQIALAWKRVFIVLLLTVVFIFSQSADSISDVWTISISGILFSILICLTLPLNSNFRINDKSVLSRLGMYTYGFYLYHTLVINLLLKIFEKYTMPLSEGIWAIVFTVMSFTISIGISMLSYHLFEKQFLKLKVYFR